MSVPIRERGTGQITRDTASLSDTITIIVLSEGGPSRVMYPIEVLHEDDVAWTHLLRTHQALPYPQHPGSAIRVGLEFLRQGFPAWDSAADIRALLFPSL